MVTPRRSLRRTQRSRASDKCALRVEVDATPDRTSIIPAPETQGVEMNTVAATRPSPLARWAALGGVLYVVLFIIGTILLYSGSPNSSSSPGRVIAWYSSSAIDFRIAEVVSRRLPTLGCFTMICSALLKR